MNEDQVRELLEWIRHDRLKLAVLEAQVIEMRAERQELKAAIAAMNTKLDNLLPALREANEKAIGAHTETCAKLQAARDGTGSGGGIARWVTAAVGWAAAGAIGAAEYFKNTGGTGGHP